MKSDNFFWGLLFLLIGGLILAINFGYIEADSLRALIDLWPLIFVIFGLRIIFGAGNPIYITLVLLIFMAAAIYVTDTFNIQDLLDRNSLNLRARDFDFNICLDKKR